MKKAVITIMALAQFLLPVRAQSPAELQGSSRRKVIDAILEANDISRSLSFDFVMTRYSALVSEKLESSGRLAYVYPDKVRWEVEKPRSSVYILNGASTGDRRQQALLRSLSGLSGRGLVNEEDFKVTVYADSSRWQVDMVPLRRDLSRIFSMISILADPADGRLCAVVLSETGGDLTEIRISRLNFGLVPDESLFVKP